MQVVFEHIAHVDYIEERVRQESEKLEQFGERISSVRAVIGRPQHRRHKGDTYSVRLHLRVPGSADIAVSRDPAETGRQKIALTKSRGNFLGHRIGTKLIDAMVRSLGGTITRTFDAGGLRCSIAVPLPEIEVARIGRA